jgi:O-acetyl-ADP-ribose deacetylase (regulator of RNase III)
MTNFSTIPPLSLPGARISTFQGDIAAVAKQECGPKDIVVNAANADLLGPGGGTNKALYHLIGSKQWEAERTRLKPSLPLQPGGCVAMSSGLATGPAAIFQLLGPIPAPSSSEKDLLQHRWTVYTGYQKVFSAAGHSEAKTVVTPLISSGIYAAQLPESSAQLWLSYVKQAALKAACEALNAGTLKHIVFVDYAEKPFSHEEIKHITAKS